MTRVVHINDHVPGAVYVGRAVGRRGIKGSKWGNPFGVRRHGRSGAIQLYRNGLEASGSIPLIGDLHELRNAPALACWCRHDGEARTSENACHADVLVDLLERYTDEELAALAASLPRYEDHSWLVGHPDLGSVIVRASTRIEAQQAFPEAFSGDVDTWGNLSAVRKPEYDHLSESAGHDQWVADMKARYGPEWGEG